MKKGDHSEAEEQLEVDFEAPNEIIAHLMREYTPSPPHRTPVGVV
jgi:hypothetical protein